MTKSTRRALFSSVVALVLCLTMLIGTTFAWFTDTASTSVNTIVSGTLNVELGKYVGDEWVSLEGETLDFVKADGAPEDEEILWEPGCEYNLEEVVIRNNGNLALKYTVVVSGIDGDAKLNEAIKWEINVAKTNDVTTTAETGDETGETVDYLLPGDSATLTISGQMKEDAGNEYQGLTIEGAAITVYATQYTYEFDSNDDQYDAGATLPSIWDGEVGTLPEVEDGVLTITNAGELAAFAQEVNKGTAANTYAGVTVVLNGDIDLAGYTWTPIGLEGSLHNNFQGTFDGNGHTIYNMYVSNSQPAGFFGYLTGTVENLTFENATVEGNHWAGVVAGYASYDGTTIENCTVVNSTVTCSFNTAKNDDGDKAGIIVGYLNGNITVKNNTVEDCTVTAYRDAAALIGCNGTTTDSSYITGNTVTDSCVYIEAADYADEIVGRKLGGYTVDASNTAENVTVVCETTAVSNAEELAAALNVDRKGDAGTIVLTSDITVENWTPAQANYASFVLDGNGHSISGLTDALISAIGPDCDVTIKNLTVKNPAISDTRTTGTQATVGAIIRCINSEGGNVKLTIDNCHVNGGSIHGWKYAGGFVGMVGGGSGNSVVIKNSSIKNVAISTTDSSVGGFVAHTHSDVTFENCSVLGNTTVECEEDRNGGDAKAGALIGTVNANTTTITNCTVDSTVKVTNVNSADPLNNGMVGRNYGTVNAN